jgi:hypothetical protein
MIAPYMFAAPAEGSNVTAVAIQRLSGSDEVIDEVAVTQLHSSHHRPRELSILSAGPDAPTMHAPKRFRQAKPPLDLSRGSRPPVGWLANMVRPDYQHQARALIWIGLVVASVGLAYALNTALVGASEASQEPGSPAPAETGNRIGLQPDGTCLSLGGCWSPGTGGYAVYPQSLAGSATRAWPTASSVDDR